MGWIDRTRRSRSPSEFFRLRVWTADDVIEQITKIYERLPDDLQADLPLKRIWTVVLDEVND